MRRRVAQGRHAGGQVGALSGAPGASGLLGPAGVFAVLALGALDLGLEQSIVLPALR